MAIESDDIKEIVRRYDRGNGEAISALATAYNVTDGAIRYHLKKQNVLGSDGPKIETNDDLGIDEDDAKVAADVDLSALMANPKFAALLDAAVAQKVLSLGLKGAAAPASEESTLKILADSIKHTLKITASQQPGYIKPLDADEVDRRAAGYVNMLALLKDFKDKKTPPKYILGGPFHGPSEGGPHLYPAGTEVTAYVPPSEHFMPVNEPGHQVYAAMLQWIGGPSPEIGDRIIAEHAAQKGDRYVIGDTAPAMPDSPVIMTAPPKAPEESKNERRPLERQGVIQPRAREVTGPSFVG